MIIPLSLIQRCIHGELKTRWNVLQVRGEEFAHFVRAHRTQEDLFVEIFSKTNEMFVRWAAGDGVTAGSSDLVVELRDGFAEPFQDLKDVLWFCRK